MAKFCPPPGAAHTPLLLPAHCHNTRQSFLLVDRLARDRFFFLWIDLLNQGDCIVRAESEDDDAICNRDASVASCLLDDMERVKLSVGLLELVKQVDDYRRCFIKRPCLQRICYTRQKGKDGGYARICQKSNAPKRQKWLD
jgi:hypothetical protein